MSNVFEQIAKTCNHREVKGRCKELAKKLDFGSSYDVMTLCELAYWLYILDQKELAKKCIKLIHDINLDYNNDKFLNILLILHIYFMRGLEIRIFKEEGKNNEADEIIKAINKDFLLPANERKLCDDLFANARKWIALESVKQGVSKQKNVKADLIHIEILKLILLIKLENLKVDILKLYEKKTMRKVHFSTVLYLIGNMETGLNSNLNNNKEKIEEIIKEYIKKLK